MSKTRRITRLLLGAVLVAIGLGFAVPLLLDLASEHFANQVEQRLGSALGGNCKISSAQLLSRHDIALQELACVLDEGPVLGVAARTFSARFEDPLTRGKLSAVRALAIDGLELRLRELPQLPQRTAEATPESAGPEPSERSDSGPGEQAETVLLRLLELSDAIGTGRGTTRLIMLRKRLAQDSTIRVDRAQLSDPGGRVLLSNLHGQLSRKGEQLGLAVALDLAEGGIASLDGTLTRRGLEGARLRLEQVPVADTLNPLLGERLSVRKALLSASLQHLAQQGSHDWKLEAGLSQLTAGEGFLGPTFVEFPRIRLQGQLSAAADQFRFTAGSWEVAALGGKINGNIGPLGQDDPARFKIEVDITQLPLGKLLGSLPDALIPSSWSEEIVGTLDLKARVEGPLHQRSAWALDWSGDFSRMVLASGELASLVERLQGPFEHRFVLPKNDQGRQREIPRLIGGTAPHFTPIKRISRHLINAVVSTEDAGFFGHAGFEPHELKEAMLENLREGAGRGGSTITQQLAKNLFLSGERSLARKLKEAIIAWRLETDLPKERILEIYLNIAEWGPGIYGITDAADHYFGRSPRVLRPEEAAFLASLLPSPRRYHGYYHQRGVTRNRQSLVQDILHSMYRMGRLEKRALIMALDEPIEMTACSF